MLCRGNGGEIMAGVVVDRGTFVRGRSIDACAGAADPLGVRRAGAARSSGAATAFKARGGQIPNQA
jgi:rare lipoprotein A (peptidoglycan hydrolase)